MNIKKKKHQAKSIEIVPNSRGYDITILPSITFPHGSRNQIETVISGKKKNKIYQNVMSEQQHISRETNTHVL